MAVHGRCESRRPASRPYGSAAIATPTLTTWRKLACSSMATGRRGAEIQLWINGRNGGVAEMPVRHPTSKLKGWSYLERRWSWAVVIEKRRA